YRRNAASVGFRRDLYAAAVGQHAIRQNQVVTVAPDKHSRRLDRRGRVYLIPLAQQNMLHEHADVRVIFNEEYPSQGWRTPPERLARRTETLTLLTRSRRPRQSGFLTDVNCCAFRDGPFWLPLRRRRTCRCRAGSCTSRS